MSPTSFQIRNTKQYHDTRQLEKNENSRIDWFLPFKFKYGLSVRKPEAIRHVARATAFNRYTVGKFFDKLGDLYNRYKFEIHDIYNLDETRDVVAPTAKKNRIGSVTSAKRGELVTYLAIKYNVYNSP